jgi:amidase
MDGVELAFAGMARQAELIRSRQVSSRELAELYLSRIERLDPQLNAFLKVFSERALTEADAADRRVADGVEGEGAPLLGVPFAVKDVEDVAGEVTACGTAAFDEPAVADSELVRRLRDAGAVLIGKTNLPELAICGFTESKTNGVTRNPWNPGRTSGGSSGGSGTAVAAGLVGVASASDGAGSIRIPAAFCGLFGLKVQRGRVPIGPPGHWHGLSVNGCLSRSVLDTALFLDLTLTRDGGHGAPPPPNRPYVDAARTAPGKLRIAVSDRPVRALAPPIVTDEVKNGLAETESLLRSLGHDVRREDPSYGGSGNRVIIRYSRGIHDDVQAVPAPRKLERRTRGFGRLGAVYPAWLAHRATSLAERDAARINRIFETADVLITPTVGETAIEVGRWARAGALRTELGMSRTYCFTPIWNHTGQPAASVPAGFTDDGLPLAVQLIGRPNDEATLISLAAQMEAERPWADARPPAAQSIGRSGRA